MSTKALNDKLEQGLRGVTNAKDEIEDKKRTRAQLTPSINFGCT